MPPPGKFKPANALDAWRAAAGLEGWKIVETLNVMVSSRLKARKAPSRRRNTRLEGGHMGHGLVATTRTDGGDCSSMRESEHSGAVPVNAPE